MTKTNMLVLIKASSEDEDERRLQDVFNMSSSRRMFAGYKNTLKIQVCLMADVIVQPKVALI